MIKFFGLDRQYAALKDELLDATDQVLRTGKVLDGQYVRDFEAEIAWRTDRRHAIAVNSCSQALLFAYMTSSHSISGPRRVAIPALSFVATANAPAISGWDPVFVDVDDNGLMDLNKLNIHDDKVTIVSYVNLFGNVIDYDKLKLMTDFFGGGVRVIEDAAQSFGASYKGIPSGKLGDISCLSFDPTKNLPNYGSGGMLLTDDYDIAEAVRNFRDNGKLSNHAIVGTNSKMSEVDCAQMLVKLEHFDEWQERRAKIANFYYDCLNAIIHCPTPNPDVVHAWHKYVVQTPDQYGLQSHLQGRGIETKIHYDEPLPLVQVFEHLAEDTYPNATTLSRTCLSLPIYPEMTDDEVVQVVDAIQQFYN